MTAHDAWITITSTLDVPCLNPEASALLVVDLQRYCGARDAGTVRSALERGERDAAEYYMQTLCNSVLPNSAAMIAAFRARSMPVIYTRIEALTSDGRDRGREHKRRGILVPRGSVGAEILEEVRPEGDDVVLSKTSTDGFATTVLRHVLHAMNVRTLVLCGVVTQGCVLSTARSASSLGFDVIVLEDACTSWTQDMHRDACRSMHDRFATVMSTASVIDLLGSRG